MTNMIPAGQIMKTDEVGRVRTPRSRQEELLDEFERSGISGAKFATLVGVKYQTLVTWVRRRRKQREGSAPSPTGSQEPVRWIEALVDQAHPKSCGCALIVHLPGGVRMEVTDPVQAALAAQVLKLLQKEPGAC